MSSARFTRQTRLPEVGRAGQAHLEAAVIQLATRGDASDIERRYLEAAGVKRVEPLAQSSPVHLLPFEVRDPAVREVARGAHAALAALRRVWIKGGVP
jgi:hypothetical protein